MSMFNFLCLPFVNRAFSILFLDAKRIHFDTNSASPNIDREIRFKLPDCCLKATESTTASIRLPRTGDYSESSKSSLSCQLFALKFR